jgi:hypothetical protein
VITTQDTDPLAQLQQRLDAVLLRLQRIEEAAEAVLRDAHHELGEQQVAAFRRERRMRELREALDAG